MNTQEILKKIADQHKKLGPDESFRFKYLPLRKETLVVYRNYYGYVATYLIPDSVNFAAKVEAANSYEDDGLMGQVEYALKSFKLANFKMC